MDIGPYGIWTFNLDLVPSSQAIEHVAELEELGFGAVWIPEAVGREPFASAAILLRGGEHIVVATGIAGIYSRDAMTAAAGQKTLAEAYPDRFLLGLGVSHQVMVEGIRGHSYDKPYTAMKDYLARMDNALFMAAPPTVPPKRVLAALRPRMLRLAAEHADGALPYFVPPEHTAFARETLGEGPLLAVEQAVVFETDPGQGPRHRPHPYLHLHGPAQLHGQPRAIRIHRRRLHPRRQRPPDRRHRGLGRHGHDPRTGAGPSRRRCRSRLHPSRSSPRQPPPRGGVAGALRGTLIRRRVNHRGRSHAKPRCPSAPP